jgi:arsenite-transporting ATPase
MIVNRLLPDDVDGEFLRGRREQERSYREEIDREFKALPRIYLPLFSHDVHGIDALGKVSELLMAQLKLG